MYTLNSKGKPDPKNKKQVKIEMIFYKTGYTRVINVISVTGYYKDWNEETQNFQEKNSDLVKKNKQLTELKVKYMELQKSGKIIAMNGRRFNGLIALTRKYLSKK